MTADERFAARRFRTAARHYLAGRVPYAPALFERIVLLCGLGAGARVLDLGCGPGQLARGLAPHVAEVVALDPEPEMLAVATAEPGPGNIAYHRAGSDDLPGGFGRFDLVAMGRSFHCMAREETLRRLDGMVTDGGAVALLRDTHPAIPANGWWREYRAILRRFSDDDAATAARRAAGYVPNEAVLLQSPYARLERVGVHARDTVTIERLLERAMSMSSTSRARLGERADVLAAELRAGPGPGPFEEITVSEALLGWRP